MEEKEKKEVLKKKEKDLPEPRDVTICEATAQMLIKARKDGVETAFDRAFNMKACPIGAESACCKHCFMGPCRLNARTPMPRSGSAAPPSTRSRRAISRGWSLPAARRTPITA